MTQHLVLAMCGIDKTQMAQVWAKMKAGGELKGREIYIAQAMALHPQWSSHFEGLLSHDAVSLSDEDPLLHVALHIVVGSQICTSVPPEAELFYRTRLRKGDKPHDVLHMMMSAYQRHVAWMVQHADPDAQMERIDLASYGQTLRSLWSLNSRKLLRNLEGGC